MCDTRDTIRRKESFYRRAIVLVEKSFVFRPFVYILKITFVFSSFIFIFKVPLLAFVHLFSLECSVITIFQRSSTMVSSSIDDIAICSLNVRRLVDDKKRHETFLWLKKNVIIFICYTGDGERN